MWISFQRILTPNLSRLSRMGIGWDRDQAPQKSPCSKFQELEAGPAASHGEGPLRGSRSPDDERLFAMYMFCIFSRFAALAAGAAGKKAALLGAAHLLTVINDSLLPSPPPCRSAHEAGGSSEIFTNGWKPRQTGIVRPQGGQGKAVPSQLAPC